MGSMRLAGLSLLLVAGMALVGCQGGGTGSGKPVIYADSYPIAYFAERIGGEDFEVICPVPAGTSPEAWNPTAADLAKFQSASLVLTNGTDLSPWLSKASISSSKLIDTAAGFKDKLIELADGDAKPHSHGDGPEHTHAGQADMTWMDMLLAVKQAEAVHDALVKLNPSGAEDYAERFAQLEQKLNGMDQGLDVLLAPLKASGDSANIVGSHPAYSYMARRYGLKIDYVNWDPSQTPTAAQLEELKSKGPKFFFWESQPSAAADKAVTDLGINTVVIATCVTKPAEGDWLTEIEANKARLKDLFAKLR